MYTIDVVEQILEPKQLILANKDSIITHLVYDSRKVIDPVGSIFFALQAVRDGHRFIGDAYAKGVRNFVISETSWVGNKYSEANFFVVDNALGAMQKLAAHVRSKFTKPVIGITGSNGKTVVKEWLTELLGVDKKIYQSPKSYNSQLGVALALWDLNDDYDYAIIEAGISLPNEMDSQQVMIRPDIGVLTNIGQAHASGFSSKEEKAREKVKLFSASKVVISPGKYNIRDFLNPDVANFTFGYEMDDVVQLSSVQEHKELGQTWVTISFQQQQGIVYIPFTDRASIENALICVTTLLYLGYPIADITARIAKLKPLEMRLQLRKGKNNCSIIDDSYSNDLASLQIALDFLNQQQQHEKRTLILSEMEGMGAKVKEKLTKVLRGQSLYRLILVGEDLGFLEGAVQTDVLLYASTADLIAGLDALGFADESILVKGSRVFHLEDVSQLLAAKTHETVLEINLHAIEHNLKQYRSLLPPEVKLMAMVKAFSYGSGSFEVANLLQFNKVDYLTVAFADEGVELRQNGIELPIMVLSPDEQAFEAVVANRLEPEIYSFRILRAFVDFLKTKKVSSYPIHIKIDTGMHRLGFLPTELPEVIAVLSVVSEVRVASVFSHLVASGDSNQDAFTRQQIELLNAGADLLQAELKYPFMRHIANTSAIIRWPAAYLDMVRLGIGLYGMDLDQATLDLETVGQLKTTITQIKELEAGETIGYDRKGVLHRKSRIATVKIGYADGYNRRFGNGVGEMMINGQLVPTIGNICMDMCMLDVTDVSVFEEEEVLVFPDLGKAASAIGTIPYELLVGISSRVKRVYFYE
ncbi:bifunctional UDP-N-acetylmuramoyl-tripeptide:D-alanyl-D-alanine ligase/alanine racemase [Sphingobacterium psychroaquaticum]|uniref:bifunctional UDP-N-acetylmuramoyl-tripeptide:D-alanyl-D-alanine ligase/alanine racemase n=1 Tax=Sphingobacterium psychroaquaticum TaxID=561061 RepID=UPI00106D2E68|nr:bifunctional UDP-N-acetylmuramoyl-tripeptide:D-alanyl-D-alanine ligase/alanine racemase [Sphingobacterium psychroaquaticum]QBQ41522.1 bifunctional UDP-N-acetylmuramoyl-tripeptide:D-alanyl-D-alanine ligase/alanine racemase [Sphingobacterium psychroaquaticum]